MNDLKVEQDVPKIKRNAVVMKKGMVDYILNGDTEEQDVLINKIEKRFNMNLFSWDKDKYSLIEFINDSNQDKNETKLFPSKKVEGMLTDGQGGYYPDDKPIETKNIDAHKDVPK